MAHRFDPAKLDRLNDVGRLDDLVPEEMWAAFGVADARVAVEIGAGTGMFAREFSERMPAGGVLYAVDSEPVMLDWMSEHLPDDVERRIAIVSGDAAEVPLGDGIANLVYRSISTMNSTPRPACSPRRSDCSCRRHHRHRRLEEGAHAEGATTRAPDRHRGTRTPAAVAGFDEVASHDVLRYHDVVTGRRP